MKKSIIVLFITMISIYSCNKQGCTDSDSINFDNKAKQDDSTCSYESKIVFWYDSDFTNILNSKNVTSLAFIVDGKEIATSSINKNHLSAPNCNQSGIIIGKINLNELKLVSYKYQVKDNFGEIIVEKEIDFLANICQVIKVEISEHYYNKRTGVYNGYTNSNTNLKIIAPPVVELDTFYTNIPSSIEIKNSVYSDSLLIIYDMQNADLHEKVYVMAYINSESELQVTNSKFNYAGVLPILLSGTFSFAGNICTSTNMVLTEIDGTTDIIGGTLSFSGSR